MRNYVVHFITERRDASNDEEIVIKAVSPYAAMDAFIAKGIVHKRLQGVMEERTITGNPKSSTGPIINP